MSRAAAPGLWRIALVSLVVLTVTGLGVRHVVTVLRGPVEPMTLQVNGISYRVLHVEQVSGLSDADLGGMSHGVNSLVTTERALVRVTLEVAATGGAGGYDTSVLRAFAGRQALQPVAGSMERGSLRAGGHLEGALSYVVPRDGAELRLTADGQEPVPLIRVDVAGPPDTHEHGNSGPPSTSTSRPPLQTPSPAAGSSPASPGPTSSPASSAAPAPSRTTVLTR